MKNLLFTLSISMLSVASVYGQAESVKDTTPPIDKKEIKDIEKFKEPNERLHHYLDLDIRKSETKDLFTNYGIDSLKEKPILPKLSIENTPIKLDIPPTLEYQGPPLTLSPIIYNPFINDYSHSWGQRLDDNLWISTNSSHNTLPSIGENRTINFNFNYQPTNWLIMSGGAYGSKYNHIYGGSAMRRNFNDIGFNSNMKFILHDRIRLNAFGQYSVNGERNNVGGPMMHMYPHTYYGGSIEVKITDKFGIEGGVIRELNPWNGKWENRPFIAPVFYGN